ncbi:NAD(P)/FAD-dependent oxidoreductase [Adhaeretor mobilis]|uniref:Dehydrosqualene desaturase n=1 Tax=Adhaeretor mobilis TaxID=1930276 RepID=A0A517MPS0_9BACT|nr:FAD-dependent oxidoreductase [Adhaeretor mobilis]QDS96880.1 Dehydrosqualene desaturase [Adhaeretor mobilis]
MSQTNGKDIDADRCETRRPSNSGFPTVAVIGTGISGLTCARTLVDQGFKVTVFEKSRGVGGRMATRRAEGSLSFDHGAQYFTARDSCFRRSVDSWLHDGIVKPWTARIVALEEGSIKKDKQGVDRFVAAPAMNAVCRLLARDLDVQFRTRVMPVKRVHNRWNLTNDREKVLGAFDSVIVSAPAAQTAQLLRDVPALANEATQAQMSGCWALMLAFQEPLNLPFDAAFVQESPVSWIARNNSKPGRGSTGETWVVHASPSWSEANLENAAAEIENLLLEEFWQAVALPERCPSYSEVHRWRFALPIEPLPGRCLFNDQLLVGACGDWCGGPRVEGAFLSGMAAADRVMRSIQGDNAATKVTSLTTEHHPPTP